MKGVNKIDVYKELQQELEERKKRLERLFFSETYLTIEVQEKGWIYADWIGYQTEQSVMDGCEKMLEALKKYKLGKVLNDNTRVVGIWTPAAKWVGEDWFPRMKGAGLEQFAWVYSPSRLSQVSTDESLKSTPVPEIIQTFYNPQEAQDWLTNG